MQEDGLFTRSISYSLLLHALFFCLIALLFQLKAPDLKEVLPQTLVIEIEPTKDGKNRQIVDSIAGEKTKTAAPDAYLGAETRTVKKQTIAKSPSLKDLETTQRARPAPAVPQFAESGPLNKFGLPLNMPLPAAKPTPKADWADMKKQFGENSKDYVKGIAEGEQTALNTREFVYYTYFQRVRDQLYRAWVGYLRDIYRSGRAPASEMDLVTGTLVTLNTKGEVVQVKVLTKSGFELLDDAAVRAFNAAGPFPNPPKGLVDQRGLVEVRWEFVLRT